MSYRRVGGGPGTLVYHSQFLYLPILQARLVSFLDKMGVHLLKDWMIPNLQSMADWADELSVIQSSTVAKHHQILAECDARLSSLTQARPGPTPTTTLPRKLSRLHSWKDSVEVLVPPSTQLKQGEIYVNAKVRIWF